MKTLELIVELSGPIGVFLCMTVAAIYSWKDLYAEANIALLWGIFLVLVVKL